ncbi:MAG TPA: type II toxin-antitoxin system prevent-host-death family antitoxin [Caulobacteraceae bacterium]|nr:type II toxin-antitoxin system prevent-host-death family antitoxin [Caulobacteraceae bacterium]
MADDANKTWELAEARERLDELIERAQSGGPQTLAIDGAEPVAIISLSELKRLQERKPTFKELIREMNFDGVDLARDPRPPRDVDL